MAANIGVLQGLIIINDKFSSAFTKLNTHIEQSSKKLNKFGQDVSQIGTSLTTGLTLPIAALGTALVKTAADFESSFAGVSRTVDGVSDDLGNLTAFGEKLQDQIRGLSKEIPINVNELNEIARAAGQLGIQSENIASFTEVMAQLAVTTNLTSTQAADNISRLQNIFQSAGQDVDRFGSALLVLGKNSAATESEILEMATRIASAGVQINLTQGEVLAFATALSSIGIEAEAGGTAISKVMRDIALAISRGGNELNNFAAISDKTTKQFVADFRADAASALLDFFKGLNRLKDSGQDLFGVLDKIGINEVRMANAVRGLASSGDLLKNSLDLQAKAWQENTALSIDAAKRYKTFYSQLTLVWNRIKDNAITIGESLLPVLIDFSKIVDSVLPKLTQFADWFARLSPEVRKAIVVIAGITAAVGPAVYIFGQMAVTVSNLILLFPKLGAAISFATGPWGLIAIAIGTATLALINWINKSREASQAAIDFNERMATLEGSALSFSLAMKQSGGKVNESVLVKAREDAKQLAIQLNDSKAAWEDFVSKLPEGAEAIARQAGIGKAGTRLQVKELQELELSIASTESAYDRVKKALSSVTEVIKEQEQAADPLVDTIGTLNLNLNTLTDEQGKLLKSAQLAIDELKLEAEQAERLTKASSLGVKEFRKVELQIAKENAVRQILNPLLAEGLSLTRQQIKAIETYIERADRATKIMEAISETARLASEGFRDQLERNVIGGLQQLEQDGKEIIRRLNLKESLEEELSFAIRVSAIDEASPQFANIQRNYLDFMRQLGTGFTQAGEDAVAAGERIFNEMAQRFGWTIDQILESLARLDDQADLNRISGASRSSRAVFDAQVKRFNDLAKKYPERAADAQAEINNLTQQFWSEQLSAWSGALGFLADRFGGFFNYLNDLVNGLQQAQQFGSNVSSLFSAAGASGGTASAAGAIGGTAAIFAIVYDIVNDAIKSSKTRKYGTQAEFTLFEGREGLSFFNQQGQEVIKSIRSLIRGIEDALSISIESLEEIGIKVRNDGERFKAYFAGQLLGTYGTLDEALEAALSVALRDADTVISGISDLMRQGLQEFTPPDFDELLDFLQQLRQISDLSLSQGAIETRELTQNLDRLWNTLEKLRNLTPAVAQGFEALVFREIQAWQAWSDSVTGRTKTAAELLEEKKRELTILKAELQLRILSLRQRKLQVQADIAAIRSGQLLIGGRIGPGGPGSGDRPTPASGTGGGIIGLTYAFAIAGNVVAQTAGVVLTAVGTLSQAALDMIALLEKESDALDALIVGLTGILDALPDPSQLRLPRGIGGGDNLDSVRQFIEDRTFELAARGMSDYARQVAETTRQYEDMIEQAGRDIALRTQLIDLREQELALLRQEQIQSTVDSFREFLGLVSPFDEIRQTAEDLIADINASPFGDERKARMIGRIMNEVANQIEQLSREMAAGLFGDIIGQLERFGADERLIMEARRQMAIIEHQLWLIDAQARINILRAEGKIAQDVLNTLQAGIDFIASIDPTKFIEGGSTPTRPLRGQELADAIARDKAMVAGTTGAKNLADALKKAKDLLIKYSEQGLDPFIREIQTIVGDFKAIRAAVGDTAEVMLLYSSAIKSAIDNFLQPIKDVQRDLFFGEQSPFDILTQWARVQADLLSSQTRFRAGDLSIVKDLPSLIQQYLAIAQQVTPVGSEAYKSIFASANSFLNEVLQLSPEDLGSVSNPMIVSGVSDVVALNQAQLDSLDRIYASTNRVAAAVESLNTKINSLQGLQNVA